MRIKEMTGRLAVWAVVAAAAVGVARAQQSATIILTSGEELSAELMDLGGVGYTMRVNGQERQVPAGNVAAINFTGGSVSNSDWDKLSGNGQVMILKSGETLTGQLVDIGGSSPLRMTFRTSSGERDFSSNDIARILMSRPPNAPASNTAVSTGATSGGVTVDGRNAWTPTGLTVRRGQWVTFSSTGEIHIGGDGNPSANPGGVANNAKAPGAPVANGVAGALIGRVGNSAPFIIGSQSRVQMPAAGQLFLGVNDGNLQDHDGAFQVQVALEGVRR